MTENCVRCDLYVKFKAGTKQKRVVANVYEDGKWVRVEHWHPTCYLEAGQPYGEPSSALTRISV